MHLQVDELNFTLSEPLVTHKGVTDTMVKHVLVKLSCEDFIGYGVAVPAKEYGDTFASLTDEIQRVESIFLKYSSPFEYYFILDELRSQLKPAALSSIDMALHDLLSKKLKIPLSRLWGLQGRKIPDCARSLGIVPLKELAQKLSSLQDIPILKIKMSTFDEERLALIRKNYQGRIWVDANGAWSAGQIVEIFSRLEKYKVELVEQPLAKGELKQMSKFFKSSKIVVIADESCRTIDDIPLLVNCVDGINIKLLKCGGLLNAKNMIDFAKQRGLKIMLGCKTESMLSVSAMSNLAGMADYLDLDGHMQNVEDPFLSINGVEALV